MGVWLNILLGLLPVLVLVASLSGGHYPGATALDRLRSAVALPRLRGGSRYLVRNCCWVGRSGVRGGRLIGSALAGRAPPKGRPAPIF